MKKRRERKGGVCGITSRPTRSVTAAASSQKEARGRCWAAESPKRRFMLLGEITGGGLGPARRALRLRPGEKRTWRHGGYQLRRGGRAEGGKAPLSTQNESKRLAGKRGKDTCRQISPFRGKEGLMSASGGATTGRKESGSGRMKLQSRRAAGTRREVHGARRRGARTHRVSRNGINRWIPLQECRSSTHKKKKKNTSSLIFGTSVMEYDIVGKFGGGTPIPTLGEKKEDKHSKQPKIKTARSLVRGSGKREKDSIGSRKGAALIESACAHEEGLGRFGQSLAGAVRKRIRVRVHNGEPSIRALKKRVTR